LGGYEAFIAASADGEVMGLWGYARVFVSVDQQKNLKQKQN
jgi:hypothetical protein